MTRRRKILVADLLCGAGGSTTGCERALVDLGVNMADVEFVCVNHWPTAIETHTLNHPRARHFVQDIATGRPHIMVPEGYLDLLMASPTCTHHSNARGGKPTSDQQRSDPWHIITWLTELRVKRLIIENVWEFTGWGPVDDKTGRPIKERKGEYFNAWIATLRALGFEPEWKKLNAADYGDATTRKRFILMARSDGRRVSWPMPTHAQKPDEGLALFPGMQPWRAAREIIDWDIKGRSIFNRDKDLAPKTLERIYAGAVKYSWPEPYLVILRQHMGAQSVDSPIPTLSAGGLHIGLAQPVIGNLKKGTLPLSADDALPTLSTHASLFAAEGIILPTHSSPARSADEPMHAFTTGGASTMDHPGCARPMLVEPFVLSQASGGAPRGVTNPIPTQTTGGAGGAHALVVPVTNSNGGALARSVEAPVPTMTTAKGGEFAVVMPVTHQDGSDRVRDTSAPIPTVTGAHRGELAFVTAQFGEREGQAPRVHDIDQPASTGLTLGKGGLIEGVEGYDILFRMLEPHELAAAMGFTTEDQAYEFAGNKTEKIKQIGNAVSVRKMKACVGAIMADAAPRRRAKPPIIQEKAA